MDPFSIATGVLGVLATAATVIKFLDTVTSTIKDAPKTISWAQAEVRDVHSTIARLHDLFEHIQSVSDAVRGLVGVQDAAVAVSELVSSFDHLIDILGPFGVKDPTLLKTWDKAKWALRQDDVARAIVRIQTHKGSLTLMLNILQCESDVVALESRAALEKGINTLIEGSTAIQQRLERMERLFMACLDDRSSTLGNLKSGASSADVLSIRSATGTVRAMQTLPAPSPQSCPPASPPPAVGTTEMTQDVPSFRLEFEETLAESGVYRRVSRPLDTFSILSRGDGYSVARTVMTTYSLADNASVLSAYPILDRSDLRHPEFYTTGNDKSNQPRRRYLSSATARRLTSPDSQSILRKSVSGKLPQAPPNCGEDVMGQWHLTVRRIWRPTKLRFEVQFEIPVIFVCPPTNKNGPVKGSPIIYVDGTYKSMQRTYVLPMNEEARRSTRATTDNARATWVTLLTQLQSMERESWEWQLQHYGPITSPFPAAKKKSWDTMPGGVKKPYAVTTICHMIEIVAMMGMYWKDFDRSTDRYRAEGNGLLLTGTQISDLGLTFSFQHIGGTRFQENRVVPVDEVKELCCGCVSTIFRPDKDTRRRGVLKEDPRDLGFLRLGSFNEIAEALTLIGCNTITVSYIRSQAARHGHLFPIPFELVGMLGKTLHIRNRPFRTLPNPVPYHWEPISFNLEEVIREYSRKIKSLDCLGAFRELEDVSQSVHGALLNNNKRVREDRALAAQFGRQSSAKDRVLSRGLGTEPGELMELLETLHDALDKCDHYLNGEEFNLVRLVLREHVQEVLKQVNGEDDEDEDDDYEEDRLSLHDKRPNRRFEQVLAASPEDRQREFINMYFDHVLSEVRLRAVCSYSRMDFYNKTAFVLPVSPESQGEYVSDSELDADVDRPSLRDTTFLESRVAAIWCTLVLRMLCWLRLHHFDQDDLQLSKSELLGSRMPVYIL